MQLKRIFTAVAIMATTASARPLPLSLGAIERFEPETASLIRRSIQATQDEAATAAQNEVQQQNTAQTTNAKATSQTSQAKQKAQVCYWHSCYPDASPLDAAINYASGPYSVYGYAAPGNRGPAIGTWPVYHPNVPAPNSYPVNPWGPWAPYLIY